MKVKKAIEKLQRLNPEAELKMHIHGGKTVLFIEALTNDDTEVWLECEDDIDLGNELDARFKYAAETQMDELDFYMDLLEIGITIEMVQKYMGKEYANHMTEFCKEHGLI